MDDADQLGEIIRGRGPRRIGPYRLVKRLGAGGMGTVYEAIDERTSERVAVKVLHNHLLFDPAALERFKREIGILNSVIHEHIVAIREFGEHEGEPYFVMDYVAGAALSGVIERLGSLAWDDLRPSHILAACAAPDVLSPPQIPLPHGRPDDYWAAVAHIALVLTQALAYLHAKGILHRDIKPSNVVLRPDGLPVLMDMGIARAPGFAALTTTSSVVGSLRYMAPEQLAGGHPVSDEQTDLYQLGATLYELVYLEPAFPQEDELALRDAKLRVDPVPPSRAPEPPDALRSIILRCLSRDRHLRYQAALNLATDLDKFTRARAPLSEHPTLTVPVLEPAVPRPPRARHRVLIAAATLAASAAVLALASGSFFFDWPLRLGETLKPVPPPPRPPPNPPVPAPTPNGNLAVTVEPEGAVLWVEGLEVGPALKGIDFPVLGLAPREYALKVTKDGYQTVERKVTVEAGKTVPVRLIAEPLPRLTWQKLCAAAREGNPAVALACFSREAQARIAETDKFLADNAKDLPEPLKGRTFLATLAAKLRDAVPPLELGDERIDGDKATLEVKWPSGAQVLAFAKEQGAWEIRPPLPEADRLKSDAEAALKAKREADAQAALKATQEAEAMAALKAKEEAEARLALKARQEAEAQAAPKAKQEADAKAPLKVYTAWPFDAAEAKRRQAETAKAIGVLIEETVDLGNGVELTMVLIPPGEFDMGSPENEEGRAQDESLHRVSIAEPFWIGKYEVTR